MDARLNSWMPWQVRQRRGTCRAFTVLELLVAVAIIGILVSLLLPALMYAREAARRTTCTNQLRQVGVAIHSHHASRQRLPLAWQSTERDANFVYGWAAQLLPELEEHGIQQSCDFKQRPADLISSPDSSRASVPLLLCPSDIVETTFDLHEVEEHDDSESKPSSQLQDVENPIGSRLMSLPTASYVGVFGTVEADEFQEFHSFRGKKFSDGSVVHDRRIRFSDLQRGLSSTLLVGERTMATVPSTWLGVDLRGEDATCRLVGSAITRPNCTECDECEFTSRHAGGANFLWADGHVSLVENSVDSDIYRLYARRDLQ